MGGAIVSRCCLGSELLPWGRAWDAGTWTDSRRLPILGKGASICWQHGAPRSKREARLFRLPV